ncbi:MAG: hypothetical protein ABIO06_09585 [Pseudolysinimonas sp.]
MSENSYTVTATITVRITNPTTVTAISAMTGGGSGDERSQLQAAMDAGLKELPGIGQRYGIQVLDSHADVAAVDGAAVDGAAAS